MSRALGLLGIGVVGALLGGCVTYPDSYYYADNDGYSDYYYEPSQSSSSYHYDDYDDSWWPYYSTVLYPVYSTYYDPWYSPGFYYGVTYYPNYRYTSYYARYNRYPYTFAYSPYRYSWWDNYYDWGGYGWGGYYGGYYGYYNNRHHHRDDRDSYGGADWRRPSHGGARYGSARNEAERMAHRDGVDRTASRDYLPREADQRRRQGGYYGDGYREPVSGADPTITGGRPQVYGQGARPGRLPANAGPERPTVRENYWRPYDRDRDYGEGGNVDPNAGVSTRPGMRYVPGESGPRPATREYGHRDQQQPNYGTLRPAPTQRPLGSATPNNGYERAGDYQRDSGRYQRAQDNARRYESTTYSSPRPAERVETRDWSSRSNESSGGGWSRSNDSGRSFAPPPQPRSYEQPRAEPQRNFEPQRSYEAPQRSAPEPRGFDRGDSGGGFDRGGGGDRGDRGGARGQVERIERDRDRNEN